MKNKRKTKAIIPFAPQSSANSISLPFQTSTLPNLQPFNHLFHRPYLKIAKVKDEIHNLSALTQEEKKQFETIRNSKRKAEWLSARLAAKNLVLEKFGLKPQSVLVANDANRRPLIQLQWPEGISFYISLSHSGDFCACAMNPGLGPLIGVDVEKVEKRAEVWKRDYFTEEEVRYCAGSEEKFTRLWTLKEAALKLLGLGLSVDAKEAEITGGRINFHGRALARYRELREPAIRWESVIKDNYIVSVVWA